MHPNLSQWYSCVLAPLMVDVAIWTTVPVHVFNQHSYLVVIRQDFVVRQIEPVEVVSTISRYDNPSERDNFSAGRWVLLTDGSTLLNKATG